MQSQPRDAPTRPEAEIQAAQEAQVTQEVQAAQEAQATQETVEVLFEI